MARSRDCAFRAQLSGGSELGALSDRPLTSIGICGSTTTLRGRFFRRRRFGFGLRCSGLRGFLRRRCALRCGGDLLRAPTVNVVIEVLGLAPGPEMYVSRSAPSQTTTATGKLSSTAAAAGFAGALSALTSCTDIGRAQSDISTAAHDHPPLGLGAFMRTPRLLCRRARARDVGS